MSRGRALIAAAAGVLFVAAIWFHVDGVNGPPWWRWNWMRAARPLPAILLMALAAAPALLARLAARKGMTLLAALLLGLTTISLAYSGTRLYPFGATGAARIDGVLRDPTATSYFTAAQQVLHAERGWQFDWLRDYPALLDHVPLHAATKPPGPTGFFLFLTRSLGPERAPLAAGYAILLLAGAAAMIAYWSMRTIAGDAVALESATLFALAPSMTIFYPSVDLLYAALSAAALALWFVALESRRALPAVAFGMIVFLMTMSSWSLLVTGAAFVLMLLRRRNLRAVAIALGTIAIAHLGFRAITGYDLFAAFRAALRRQAFFETIMPRSHPRSIPWDLSDFAFGAGWLTIALALIWLARAKDESPPIRAAALAALATPPIVALTGLLQTETARVWIFLIPFVALPAGLELARWPGRLRVAMHALLLAGTISVYLNVGVIGA